MQCMNETNEQPALVAYLAAAIVRASSVYRERASDDPAHPLALGEVVALFNLADEFGLVAELRPLVDRTAGHDVYRALSEAMKAYYLRPVASAPQAGPPPRSAEPPLTTRRPYRPGGPPRRGRPPERPNGR